MSIIKIKVSGGTGFIDVPNKSINIKRDTHRVAIDFGNTKELKYHLNDDALAQRIIDFIGNWADHETELFNNVNNQP